MNTPPEEEKDFTWAYYNDATVNRMTVAGRPQSEIIAALAAEKEVLFKEIHKLSLIAPRKFTAPDGNTYVYRCPVNLIPEIKP